MSLILLDLINIKNVGVVDRTSWYRKCRSCLVLGSTISFWREMEEISAVSSARGKPSPASGRQKFMQGATMRLGQIAIAAAQK